MDLQGEEVTTSMSYEAEIPPKINEKCEPVQQSRIKVTLPVYFLILLIEECAEIIHRTCKAIRFGLDEKYNGITNREYLETEITDFKAAVYLNKQHGNLSEPGAHVEAEAMGRKVRKIHLYRGYSETECGTIAGSGEILDRP